MQAEAQQKKDKVEAQVQRVHPWKLWKQRRGTARLLSGPCLGGSGTTLTGLITSTPFERPVLRVSEQSL